MVKNNYITPQGQKKLVDELNLLLQKERPEIIKLVQWAASNGDRSENADYLYGKKRLREIDRRIRFLTSRLDAALVVDPLSITAQQTIQFGATVEVLDQAGHLRTFSIIGVDEVDTARDRISWQSPIGKNLIGKRVGEEVTITIPAGEVTYEITRIIYQVII